MGTVVLPMVVRTRAGPAPDSTETEEYRQAIALYHQEGQVPLLMVEPEVYLGATVVAVDSAVVAKAVTMEEEVAVVILEVVAAHPTVTVVVVAVPTTLEQISLTQLEFAPVMV